jgi:valyl-tRNA synthetase
VEKQLGITAPQAGRNAFIEKCLEISATAEADYQSLWQRLGLSVDWRYSYRTIDARSRKISQFSFIDLFRKGLVYRREAPAIWCPECRTAIAQAELNDLNRESEYVTLDFRLGDGSSLPVATTRPELLPACVAIFVHPQDSRYRSLVGRKATVPLYDRQVPILEDPDADPEKGTGAVMCCTFGDTTDVAWWRIHHLPLIEALDRAGRMTSAAGRFAGLTVDEARLQIKFDLEAAGFLLSRQPTVQSVRVHERCDTPVEYVILWQWFVRVLEYKSEFLQIGDKIAWHPEHMRLRYRSWVENLSWDWCISRQRYFGVPFPVWFCQSCGQVNLADEDQLPVDLTVDRPSRPCQCGSSDFTPETDVMDTWATSSLSPQIVGQWLDDPAAPTVEGQSQRLYSQVFPFSLRPQAHEIIRTWAFYTIVKSHFHFDSLPWHEVLISGWGLAGEGMGKISKSRGGGPMPPMEMIEQYSADAIRYWAASTGTGKDAIISEEKIAMGARLVTKLWNVARFSERFLTGYQLTSVGLPVSSFSPADRWILARTQSLIRRVTSLFENYEYAAAKNEIETFFWQDLADNYLEMSKQRLYDEANPQRPGALFALYHSLAALLKLLAPLLPFITEAIYQELFARDGSPSIHTSSWPEPVEALEDPQAEALGETLVEIASAVRRYKSERNLPLGTRLSRLQLATGDAHLTGALQAAAPDLSSVTRADQVEIVPDFHPAAIPVKLDGIVSAAILP